MEKISKISVSDGIYWVEIPQARLRVLCGCPGDAVKHLIKRGLIVEKEKHGIVWETGPNAILLSDVMLQKGAFANLAEFPVLHMLYKQGMILPNHPNNTGEKPLVIGITEQVDAQMQYIYRGNYGLVSREEMSITGIEEAVAKEMMRLKLRFAFGHIRPASDLVDWCVVDHERVEIRNGVYIRRLAINVFEFEYDGETVIVDLNLGPDEQYEAAYPLGYQHIPREYFGIIHSGEGDGWDANRPTMSSVLMFQGKVYLIDAGPNLSYNLTALGIGLDEIEGIFHTHAHDDHFAGITTLMQAGHKIKYYATPLVRSTVEKKIAALLSVEEERLRDFFEIHDLKFDIWNDIEGLEVKPIFSPHPVETSIFVFRTLWADGYKTYGHFADIVSLDVLKDMITESPEKAGVTREFYEQVKREYLQTTDLKKIDIGGGLIHGVAADFRDDQSGKILLSHNARALTPVEKEIGSSAPYGIADILIGAEWDYPRARAYQYLQSYFPNAQRHYLRILMNGEIEEFNPGVIIYKEGQVPANVLLILTGMVEKISSRDDLHNQLSAGSLIGEIPGLKSQPMNETYRAAGYVRALKIPSSLYIELVRRNGLLPKIEKTSRKRAFLQSTALFGEGIPYPVLGRIVDAVQIRKYSAGEIHHYADLGPLSLIHIGKFARIVGDTTVEILGARDFFGDEGAMFDLPSMFQLQALEDAETYEIPGHFLRDIPIVRWKLFETYHKRATRITHAGNIPGLVSWREEYAIQNSQMDTHHRKLLEIANSIAEMIRTKRPPDTLQSAFEALMDYAHYHFMQEEALMELYQYPGTADHRLTHRRLIEEASTFRERVRKGLETDAASFQAFFQHWLIDHILTDDRLYGVHLNSRGVY